MIIFRQPHKKNLHGLELCYIFVAATNYAVVLS
jgi:hypothetical protein